MTELERLMLNLETSVKSEGEKPLTNKWLLILIKITLKQIEQEATQLEMAKCHDPNWD